MRVGVTVREDEGERVSHLMSLVLLLRVRDLSH